MNLKHFLLITAICSIAGAAGASAEVFQWRDPQTKLTLTFPDTWRQISNQQPDDIVTIAAPGSNDYATCRMRVRDDRRFLIYPRKYAAAIQRTNYSHDFWDKYVGEFDGAVINQVTDNAGLGSGFASWADVNFISPGATKVQKRGIMFASVYNDHAYIFECSAENDAFAKWYHPFLSVLKSIEMRPEYSQTVNSDYRKFQKDGKWRIHGQKPADLYIY